MVAAQFVARPNRFLVLAVRGGRRVRAACRDPGRLELLRPGSSLLLAPAPRGALRATRFTLLAARSGRVWVCVAPELANRVVERALARGDAPGLDHLRLLRREVTRGASRFDFLLDDRGDEVWTEVKCASHVVAGRALFPDSPTTRGTRHLRELTEIRRAGGRSLVLFVSPRPDARSLAPFGARDPAFAAALAEARAAGVDLRAFTCRVSPAGVRLDRPIPVVI